MPTRRQILLGFSLAPIAIGLATHAAAARPVKWQVLDARTRRPLKVVGKGVFATSNANDRYTAVVELAALPKDGPTLVLGKRKLVAMSWGSGFGTGQGACSWDIDRATADAIAAAWNLARQDRAPLGAGLVARFHPKRATVAPGKAAMIVLELENRGPAAVGVQLGGRNFGRDEHFAFTAVRDGAPVPTIALGPAAGGGGFQYKLMAPGAKESIEVDLRGWIDTTTPGTYQVACTYVTDAVPDTRGPQWPDHGAEIWAVTLVGNTAVVVK